MDVTKKPQKTFKGVIDWAIFLLTMAELCTSKPDTAGPTTGDSLKDTFLNNLVQFGALMVKLFKIQSGFVGNKQ